MAFREVQVHEIREILRLWLRGEGLRSAERLAGLDRKTVRRYVAAAQACGLDRSGGEGQLSDELISGVAERVRPHRTDGHGQSWAVLAAHHEEVKGLLGQGLTVVRVHELLARRGVVVPERTLHRYALEVLGHGRSARKTTVRVADGEPGAECQVDFGKMGPAGRWRVRPPPRGARPDLHRRLQPALLCLSQLPPGPAGGHRRVRGGVGVLRRGVQGRDP
jgi:hypothetical protein